MPIISTIAVNVDGYVIQFMVMLVMKDVMLIVIINVVINRLYRQKWKESGDRCVGNVMTL